MNLDHLFTATLTYREGMAPVFQPSVPDGERIGSGVGRIEGRLSGTVEWTFYAAECRYRPDGSEDPQAGRTDAGHNVCRTTPGGVIRTDDGAVIHFEARGFGLRRDDAHPKWHLTAALRFSTAAAKYRWLNDALGLWEGDFDESSSTARYDAFIRRVRSGR